MLKRRKESDTYLATVCRHRWTGRLSEVLAGAARGKQEVGVGEAE